MSVEIFKITLYTCGCGYKTTNSSNASKHKKVACGHEMKTETKEFVAKEDYDNKDVIINGDHNIQLTEEIDNQLLIIETKNNTISKKNSLIDELKTKYEKLKNSIFTKQYETFIDDTDNEGSGLVYFIIDRDLPDRGKIGRTKVTDVKKLKSRYSTFGCPIIFCYFSKDIKNDENTLKTILRAADCMKSNTEMVSNCKVAKQLFDNFVNDAVMNIQ